MLTWETVDRPPTCQPSHRLAPFPPGRLRLGASCYICILMAVLTNWVCFDFHDETCRYSVQLLSVVFRWLLRLRIFAACWGMANVSPIPKCLSSYFIANYRWISLTPELSKLFERLVSVRLGWFIEHSSVLATTKFKYRKGLGTRRALLCVSHTQPSALVSG